MPPSTAYSTVKIIPDSERHYKPESKETLYQKSSQASLFQNECRYAFSAYLSPVNFEQMGVVIIERFPYHFFRHPHFCFREPAPN